MNTWTPVVALAAIASSAPASSPAWPGAQAGAALQAFEAQLDSHASATAVLQAWCDAHALAPAGTRIVARQAPGAAKPPSEAARRALGLKPGMAVRYRRVDLLCGDHVLSQADNWYLPGRLTPRMNRTLDTTQTPFGAAVADLHFTRRNLQTLFLFQAPPDGAPHALPHALLRHSAVLSTGQGAPFSFVVETYTDEVLAYRPG